MTLCRCSITPKHLSIVQAKSILQTPPEQAAQPDEARPKKRKANRDALWYAMLHVVPHACICFIVGPAADRPCSPSKQSFPEACAWHGGVCMPLYRSGRKKHTHPFRSDESCCRHAWEELGTELTKAERAVRLAQDGFAFSFVEGALTRAVRQGHWLLLDEINLGPPEVALLPSHCAICWLDAL